MKKASGRAGGQIGHKGETLEMVRDPHYIQVHEIQHCPACGENMNAVAGCGVEKRQVFDGSVNELEISQHQTPIKRCPQCQALVKAAFPQGIDYPVQYGKRLKAQAVYLNSYQLLPLARVCELFGDLYGHTPSEAFVGRATQTLQDALAVSLEAIQTQLKQAAGVDGDETGLPVEGKLNWLHGVATPQLTYYAAHPKRGQTTMRAIGILTALTGRALHDAYISYFQFDKCAHALCNAHHLRELRFITEQYQQSWAEELAQLLLDAKGEVQASPDEQMCLPPERVRDYQQRYDSRLQRGYEAESTTPTTIRHPTRAQQTAAAQELA